MHDSKGTFRAALAHRGFRYIAGSLAVSGAGDWLYIAALTAYVLDETQSAGWVAAVTVVRLLPHLVLGPLGGVIADRYDRRVVLLAADVTRAVVMGLLAIAVAAEIAPIGALALAFIATAAGVSYFPAVAAMTPAIVGEEDLAAANASLRVVDHLTVALGPAIGSLLLLAGPKSIAFAANAITFIVSAILVRRVDAPRPPARADESPSLKDQLREGLQAVTRAGGVSALVGPFAAIAFTVGQAFVLLPLVSEHLIGTGSEGVGFLFAAVGVGGIAATALTRRLADSARPGLILVGAVTVAGVALVLLSQARVPVFAYLLMAAAGAGNIILNVVAITLLQRVLPTEMIGRVFGILNAVGVASLALGSLVAPTLVEVVGIEGAIMAAGGVVLAVTLPSAPRLRTLDHRGARVKKAIAPRLALLEAADIFDGATPQALEALALQITEEEVAEGKVVVREGDEPDDFFVIVTGRFAVLSAGEDGVQQREVRSLNAGDHFGEIGLLAGIPRTASVVAREPGKVLRVPGGDFLDAVSGGPGLSAALLEGMFGRLQATHPSHLDRAPAAD